MIKDLNRIAKDTNKFLNSYIKRQSKTELIRSMRYGLLPGGKKIRSKILIDVGRIFNLNNGSLIKIGAAVECIHAYSLIHDDLPCMDNDSIRRGKLSTHKKFGESTAVLTGNSLLTLAFEILSDKSLLLKEKTKVELISLISECSGHTGIAGGQYLDLNYERKKIKKNKIIDMQIKKTGKLFAFCCVAPALISNKKRNVLRFFEKIGYEIGLLFQITDDLIDYRGVTKKAGKKTKKDEKKGKATLISLLGYKNTIKYTNKIKKNILNKISCYGRKSENLKKTVLFISEREK
jgi:farnesyl diphosphate synthase|tara:strand:- start:224 stop:1096 length:873 start_codon:yes stop_codon:yes gene_type:complete